MITKLNIIKSMLLASALMAGAGSAFADSEVWVRVLPNDLKSADKVVIVDLTTKVAMGNDPDEGNPPYSVTVKLNDRNDRITDEALGDTVQWTVETQGSDNDRKLKFAAADGKYLNLINDDNGLRVGADGVNAFNFIVDEGNKRSTFLHAVVNDTSRVVGLYSMFGFSNNWRTKTSIDDQIKSTVTAFFRKSDPGKNDVILTFKNANGEENYNYEADLANGANSFAAPTLEGAPKGAVINYYSSNDKVADVDITSGAITLKRRGTTDITVVYRGDNKNNYALVTYTLRVDDANDPNGTSAHPFTVSEAIQYAKDGKGSVGYNYFVKGIVCKVDSTNNGAAGGISIPGLTNNSVEGTLTYWLSDNGVMKDSLKVSTGRGLNWSDLTVDSISVGDEVLVVGPLSYSTGSNSIFTSSSKKKNEVAVIDADNCMQTHVRKLVVENTRLYLGTTRDGTELYTIDGELNGMLGETTLKVSNTRVADVTEDGWLRTLATGHDTVTVSVPVTVTGGGTYTMSRNFRLRVITTNTRLGHFELVNDASTLQVGDSLMIVATKDDKSYAISANDAKMGGKDAFEVRIGENGTIDDDDVPDDATTITLKGTAGAWNLHTGNDTYFYTSAKKPDSSTFDFSSIMNMGNKEEEEGTESNSEKGNSEKGSTGLPDMFGGSDSNKLRNDTIVGVLGDSTMVKIAIAAEGLATITFRGDSIMRFNDELDLSSLLGMFSSTGSDDESGSGKSSGGTGDFDLSAIEGLDFSMPAFEVYHPDSIKGVLPKIYRFVETKDEVEYDYYVAELNEDATVLTFKGTNTAPDGVNSWDATNTPVKGTPDWLKDSKGRNRMFKKVVFDETFAAARPVCCKDWFHLSSIKSYEGMQNFNTSEVTNMENMFYNNWSLRGTLDLSHFNTSKVTNMEQMFYMCEVLQTIYVGNDWDISNVRNNEYMFFGCRALVGQLGSKYSDGKGYGLDRANFTEKNGLLTFNGLIIKDAEDNSAALESYNGQTLNVYYDRVFSAIDNGDGTWTSKAYSFCLPYDLDVTALRDADMIQVCQLYYVKDNKEFLFSNCDPMLEAGQGYVIVVKKGALRLCANNVTINKDEKDGIPVYVWLSSNAEELGKWRGTLKRRTNDDCTAQPTYSMDRNMYRYYRNDTEAYRAAWLTAFRAAFFGYAPLGRNAYEMTFKLYIAGDDNDPIVSFPTADYAPDADFSGYNDETGIIMHTIDNDGTHRYFDLQGRQLQSRPTKGVYIDNGNKVIK